MTAIIKCISPVDGRVYAERPALGPKAAADAVARAKAAQKPWAALGIAERSKRVLDGIAALNAIATIDTPTRLDIARDQSLPGVSTAGISEDFPLTGTRSIYGATSSRRSC